MIQDQDSKMLREELHKILFGQKIETKAKIVVQLQENGEHMNLQLEITFMTLKHCPRFYCIA